MLNEMRTIRRKNKPGMNARRNQKRELRISCPYARCYFNAPAKGVHDHQIVCKKRPNKNLTRHNGMLSWALVRVTQCFAWNCRAEPVKDLPSSRKSVNVAYQLSPPPAGSACAPVCPVSPASPISAQRMCKALQEEEEWCYYTLNNDAQY
ncbi:hypothetical protein BDD12DRAFT_22502 [Trichophaea hybrida]|nr:hypothetical protein BDD12DRAFT_22502 [Trichophaea hybrida]